MKQLVLEDGTVFVGEGFGSDCQTIGEVVFNTGMTGYQEVISDPSYCGQMITFTYPLVGNYGVNRDDFETVNPAALGVIVKEHCTFPSNFRNEETIDEFLQAKNIPGISGVDTRKLTKIIRKHGTMKAMITSADRSISDVLRELESTPLARDQVQQVSTVKPYVVPGRGERIVLMDFGMKHGILREFTKRHCHVTVVPYHTTAEEILRLKPDGVMLSNGPGDPKDVPEAIATIRKLIGQVPVFGICLGHQLIALASGADTSKMKFGHRGINQPVKDLETGRTYITSQNHGYAVNTHSLEQTDLRLTQVSLNDDSVEGVRHAQFPLFSVQYHPESSPGPEDTSHLFDEFITMINTEQKKTKEDSKCLSVQI
ncbi:carbamoyl-phosphate synthase small subunit [Halobacillus karajensis]|uniref:Carbamoyl phosphate synthase small chain n=1 Tax=Halobacillus karajensis TaxID=195088 RepID=A0A024P3S3_9BACI|nr:carbamoyl phosphate synthase small subunit [Halobacillus karajensis]CDQ19817.1 Carbamoyl-phosphate synthase small chain [Halobacillus karajensis]CDQ22277.1 Carbamoyl-phosphate synthase small chain [Halobacillus karajensis]CDQ28118.1 Carbamoyl-phosphate synthase small chain [Halobacillus karajensis]SEH71662.1 carbamoyl-phosphate synthase small subunit [Halobacillus karajensis]